MQDRRSQRRSGTRKGAARQQGRESRERVSARPKDRETRAKRKSARRGPRTRQDVERSRSQVEAARRQRRVAAAERRASRPRRPLPKWLPYLVMFLLIGCVLCGTTVLVRGCAGHIQTLSKERQEKQRPVARQDSSSETEPTAVDDEHSVTLKLGASDTTGRVRFCAVGDNIADDNILQLADGWAGELGDGTYDFSPLYRDIRSAIMGYDVALVNQETVLGGTDEYAISGTPSFNTPDSMADALAGAGFRVINCNTNHTYDYWTGPIEHSQKLWATKTSLLAIGSYESAEDRAKIRVVQRNGVRIAFLSYSYGQNGYEISQLPNDYYAVPFDEARLAEDVAAARQTANAVVVYMHWGDSYVSEPTATQVSWAQICAQNNVDLVVGSHSHVIQPVRWYERADGRSMPCAFGLGDFVCGYHDYPAAILSGMISCDFVRSGDGTARVENVVWHPLIEHWVTDEDGNVDARVLLERTYTEDMANENELLSSIETTEESYDPETDIYEPGTSPYKWIQDQIRDVIRDDSGDHEALTIDD